MPNKSNEQPIFTSEDEEREFWASHDSEERAHYVYSLRACLPLLGSV